MFVHWKISVQPDTNISHVIEETNVLLLKYHSFDDHLLVHRTWTQQQNFCFVRIYFHIVGVSTVYDVFQANYNIIFLHIELKCKSVLFFYHLNRRQKMRLRRGSV